VLVAAHPAAPLEEYLDLLRRKLIEGYRHAGFPDAYKACFYKDCQC
jgi:hypothetical protein